MSTFKIAILVVVGSMIYYLNVGATHQPVGKAPANITIPETIIKE